MYWISYSYQGKQYRENTGTDNKHFAQELLAKRQAEIREQRLFDVKKGAKVAFEELAEDFLKFYRDCGRRSLEHAETSVKHLPAYFEGKQIAEITPEVIEDYIKSRRQELSKLGRPTSPSSINRELVPLSKIFTLAIRHRKADKNPLMAVERLLEHNIRDRVLSVEEFQRLLEAAPNYLRPILLLAHDTGMRRGEILHLRWSQVDLQHGFICLEGADTKTDEGRSVPLNERLTKALKDAMHSAIRPASGPVFHRQGKPIKDIWEAFTAAYCKAAIADFRFHDLRRTAVTNMRRSHIDHLTIMKISGHKTLEVFRRYNSFDAEDLKQAAVQHHQFITNLAQSMASISVHPSKYL
jgi:integrase